MGGLANMVSVDFVGRVNNTPLSPRQALMPLLEAIFNSMQSIEEKGTGDGAITINVVRNTQNLLIRDDEQIRTSPISGFEVVDNGVGFTKENFESFNTCDTQKKRNLGGKGVGRFLWLKAFEKVEIRSVFQEEGKLFLRSFNYELNNDPVKNLRCEIEPNDSMVSTTISLLEIKPDFSEHLPKSLDVLAYRIIEHCLEYFVLKRMPVLILKDENDTIVLSEKYEEMVSDDSTSEFKVQEQTFTLTHFLLKAIPGAAHQLNFCAIHRVVCSKKIDSRTICNLPNRIPARDDSRELFYLGYISSDFLNGHVDQQRTGFNTVQDGQFRYIGDLTWEEIEGKALESVKSFLSPITEPIGIEKLQNIENQIKDEWPEFRGLLRHRREAIDEIPPDLNPDKLEIELYKRQKEWEVSLKEAANEIISAPTGVISPGGNEIKEKYLRFLEEWNESGKAALAKYVIHRKTTLSLLEKYMQSDDEGGYARERTIHELIFPLKHTSDDIDYEQQNLWIIDEKLSFHRYLASDIELRQVSAITMNENDRPDLLIFDNPIAMVDGEPINGIIIFEFKRPMRSDSNPVNQMYGYVRKIRAGKENNNHSRPITVRDETPFYCYAVCDLPNQLRIDLENMGMQKTPDNEGYFCYNSTLRAYVEVISYGKLLRDAQQRNRVLFEKLNVI
mgnify:CR=1 FL=1